MLGFGVTCDKESEFRSTCVSGTQPPIMDNIAARPIFLTFIVFEAYRSHVPIPGSTISRVISVPQTGFSSGII